MQNKKKNKKRKKEEGKILLYNRSLISEKD